MSTSAGPTAKPAPWRDTFLRYIGSMEQPAFVLSTLRKTSTMNAAQQSATATPFVPSARYCIFRGMWTELPENKHNDAARNDPVFASDCPTFTTDIRMEKVGELFGSSEDPAQDVADSGKGGAVEAVWWYYSKDPLQQMQWRVRGDAFVVGPDADEEKKPGVKAVKTALGKRLRVMDGMEGKEGEFSWTREVRAHFGNCSPGMRGTFKNPPPGKPVDQSYDENELGLGNKVTSLDDSVARRNFRVVVIRPHEVEYTDITEPTKARRYVYKYVESTGEWEEEVRWP